MKKRTIALASIVLLFLLSYLSSYPFGCGAREEIIIIGLDGGSWNIILPLIKEGKLPNLNKLMKEGVYGGLRSNDDLETIEVWTSIATGDMDSEYDSKSLWEILSENDKVVGVSYWPSVNEVNGFIIPAHYETGGESYPIDLYDHTGKLLLKNPVIDLLRKAYYMKILIPADRLDKDILYDFYLLDSKSREFFYLRDKFRPDVSAIVFYGSDRLQHYLWAYTTPERFQNVDKEKVKKYGNVVENYYKEFDKFVGRVASCNKHATIFIVSGYGFDANVPPNSIDMILVNKILEKDDFLRFDYRGEIDMINTKAYAINDEMEDSTIIKINNGEIKNQVKEMFANIQIQHTFERVFTVTEIEDEIILHRNLPLQLSNLNIEISDDIYPIQEFVYRRVFSGRRSKNGILIVSGDDAKTGKNVQNSEIYDIAPTILKLSGLDIPKEMSGKPLETGI